MYRNRYRNKLRVLTLSLCVALPGAGVVALEDDAQQDIRISADNALRDEREGVTIYQGNVQMDQGSLRLRADRVAIYRIEEEADKIVAWGNPAELEQQPAVDQQVVRANAGIIEYYKLEERVRLRNGARLEQDGSTVTGESIDYHMKDQKVRATSDANREDSRVEVVIPARALNQEGDSGTTDGE